MSYKDRGQDGLDDPRAIEWHRRSPPQGQVRPCHVDDRRQRPIPGLRYPLVRGRVQEPTRQGNELRWWRLKQSRRTIPDWGVSPFGKQFEAGSIAADIERFNLVLVKETANRGARLVNVTEVSRKGAATYGTLPTMVFILPPRCTHCGPSWSCPRPSIFYGGRVFRSITPDGWISGTCCPRGRCRRSIRTGRPFRVRP